MKLRKSIASVLTVLIVLSCIPVMVMAATDGWKKSGKYWYYYENGKMVKNTIYHPSDGDYKTYYFDKYGRMVTKKWVKFRFEYDGDYGDYTDDDSWDYKWAYFGSDGAAYENWHKIGGKWYCFISVAHDNYMLDNCLIGGSWNEAWDIRFYGNKPATYYYLGKDGAMVTNKWVKVAYYEDDGYDDSYITDYFEDGAKTAWVYFGKDGSNYKSRWFKSGGKWYYFDVHGIMLSNTSRLIDGKTYKFDSNGVCTNP